jgi:ubiquinone biosynthesis protein COQ4
MSTIAIHTTTISEENAVQIALGGSFFARARVAVGALRALLRDPTDTQQAVIFSIACNAARLPHVMAKFLDDDGLELFERQASLDSSAIDHAELRALPEDTLGYAYAHFLADNDLDVDFFQAPPGMPRVATYLAKRMRQSHDVWHAVTGLNTAIPSEIELLAFSYGQTQMPSFILLAASGAVRYAFTYPGIFRAAYRGYVRGKNAAFLGNVHWEKMWRRPLAEVREELGVH